MPKPTQIADRLLLALCALVLLAVPLASLRAEKQELSLYENRVLAAPPAYSWQALVSGEYLSAGETYFQDHIVGRDAWLRANVYYERLLLGRRVVNDVVILEDLLLPRIAYVPPVSELPRKVAEMTASLALVQQTLDEWQGTLLFVGIPEQYSAFADRYPGYIFNNAENLHNVEQSFFASLQEAGVAALKMRDIFAEQGGLAAYYLQTDHHFNYYGAYLTYRAICQSLGEQGWQLPILTEEQFAFEVLPNYFWGSRGRKLYGYAPFTDSLVIYREQQPLPFRRWDDGVEVEAAVFDLPDSAEEAVAYTLYMGGDIGETILRTERPELPNLLIFGDSFTNPLETLLYHSFNETRSLDLRYYTEQGLLDYLLAYQPEIVILVRDDNYYLIQEGNGLIK